MSETPIDVAARLGAKISPRSREIEEKRSLPLDIVDDIASAGLFKLYRERQSGDLRLCPETAADQPKRLTARYLR